MKYVLRLFTDRQMTCHTCWLGRRVKRVKLWTLEAGFQPHRLSCTDTLLCASGAVLESSWWSRQWDERLVITAHFRVIHVTSFLINTIFALCQKLSKYMSKILLSWISMTKLNLCECVCGHRLCQNGHGWKDRLVQWSMTHRLGVFIASTHTHAHAHTHAHTHTHTHTKKSF